MKSRLSRKHSGEFRSGFGTERATVKAEIALNGCQLNVEHWKVECRESYSVVPQSLATFLFALENVPNVLGHLIKAISNLCCLLLSIVEF